MGCAGCPPRNARTTCNPVDVDIGVSSAPMGCAGCPPRNARTTCNPVDVDIGVSVDAFMGCAGCPPRNARDAATAARTERRVQRSPAEERPRGRRRTMAAAMAVAERSASPFGEVAVTYACPPRNRHLTKWIPTDNAFSKGVIRCWRLPKLGRNVAEAIANIKSSLSLDSVRCDLPISSGRGAIDDLCLAQLYPGTHLPAKLASNIRKHFDSFPLREFELVCSVSALAGRPDLIELRRIAVGLLCFVYAQAEFDIKDVFLHIRLIEQAEIEDQPTILVQELLSDDSAPATP
ncbi:hypothetical protein Scep_027570 [Stephania cephalantha]|uniref:DUF7377 domain-containing protein n=1 Tax=Stephania cephalantha TaxID=152367 RepID=A0AAP0EBG2_9MAGN